MPGTCLRNMVHVSPSSVLPQRDSKKTPFYGRVNIDIKVSFHSPTSEQQRYHQHVIEYYFTKLCSVSHGSDLDVTGQSYFWLVYTIKMLLQAMFS